MSLLSAVLKIASAFSAKILISGKGKASAKIGRVFFLLF
jgi:hypothetical protein